MQKGEETSSENTVAMGGNSLCNEPTIFQTSKSTQTILQKVGWIPYLHIIEGFNVETTT